jgi:hypothetical protein
MAHNGSNANSKHAWTTERVTMAACEYIVPVFYAEENQWMPEPCGEPTKWHDGDLCETHSITEYNRHFADYITRSFKAFGQSDITEDAMLNAHAWAAGGGWADVRPPEGWVQGEAHTCANGVCGRCEGDGTLAHFNHIANGVCFHCEGSGKCPDFESADSTKTPS